MSEETKSQKLVNEVETANLKREFQKLAQKLNEKSPGMISDYRSVIKHTGGLLTSSMGYAYAKGLNDAIKLILKEIK